MKFVHKTSKDYMFVSGNKTIRFTNNVLITDEASIEQALEKTYDFKNGLIVKEEVKEEKPKTTKKTTK